MRSLIFYPLVFILFVSCSGLNSELDTTEVPGNQKNLKPQCQFKAHNNCWTKSVALLSSCMEPDVTGTVDQFVDDDMRLCQNKISGKIIQFKNPLHFLDGEDIDFRYYGSQGKCFHYQGDGVSFKIDETAYGSLSVEEMNNGDLHVQCFYGESFKIPAEAIEKGCRGQSLKVGEFLPRAQLLSFQEAESESGHQFFFQGMGGAPQSVFKCYE